MRKVVGAIAAAEPVKTEKISNAGEKFLYMRGRKEIKSWRLNYISNSYS